MTEEYGRMREKNTPTIASYSPITFHAGVYVGNAARDLIYEAIQNQQTMEADFNGTPLIAAPGAEIATVVNRWQTDRDRIQEEHRKAKREATRSTEELVQELRLEVDKLVPLVRALQQENLQLRAELQQRRMSFENQLTSNVLSAWGYTPEQIEEARQEREPGNSV